MRPTTTDGRSAAAVRAVLAAGAVLATGACGGRPAPAPSPAPAPAQPTAPASPSGATPPAAGAPTRFAYAPGSYRYDVRTETTVELVGTRERESVTTAARVTYTVAPGAGAGAGARATTVTGEVDSVAVQASARVTGGALERLASPVRFRGTVDPATRAGQAPPGPRLELVGATLQCALPESGPQAAALAAARETVLRVPASIPVGARWRDSVVAAGCSGAIPTTVTTVSRYEVVGRTRFAGVDAVRVRRETTRVVRGQGIAGGRQVTVVGTGTGEGNVYLDASAGRVVGAEEETRGTVRVGVGRDAPQEFTQRGRTRVEGGR